MVHRRVAPVHHQFTYPVSQVWIDPDRPEDLFDLHPAWSHRHPAPARFKRADFGGEPTGSLAAAARSELVATLGRMPRGPVRMLTQIRRWGWLFNPITMFFVWDHPDRSAHSGTHPVGAILEVTNTPWKERTRYPLPLTAGTGGFTTTFDKAMHVSPFLGMGHRYRLTVQDRDDIAAVDIDVEDTNGDSILHTALRLGRRPATRRLLARSLRTVPFPTHRVSAGIHGQAARLWAKGVPIVAHPRKSSPVEPTFSGSVEDRP